MYYTSAILYVYYISAGQTSLLQVQWKILHQDVFLHRDAKFSIVPEEGWFGQPKYSTRSKKHSTLCRFLPLYSSFKYKSCYVLYLSDGMVRKPTFRHVHILQLCATLHVKSKNYNGFLFRGGILFCELVFLSQKYGEYPLFNFFSWFPSFSLF